MGFFKEFREFAVKGNAVDMAVGIIIGGAFGKIVSSMVGDVIMPPLGLLLGGADFKNLEVVLKAPQLNDAGEVAVPGVALKYGMFVNTVLDFVIVALCLFIVIKLMNTARKWAVRVEDRVTGRDEPPAGPPAKAPETT